MATVGLLAQATVRDAAAAEGWYSQLLGRGPDARPMAGLLQWNWPAGAAEPQFGLQVWADPDRAGRSTVVLFDDALEAEAARLSAAGVEHAGLQPGGGGRTLQLTDPDGNRVVLIG